MAFPKVLLVGDSITLGYAPTVIEALKDVAHVELVPGSAQHSAYVLERLGDWISTDAWDAVHFNCGLHDLKFFHETQRHQVPVEDYEANLFQAAARLQRETNARLIWATITPIVEEWHNVDRDFDRYVRDVEAYNAAALRIMNEAGIEVNDLYAFILERGVRESICTDGVHMTDDASRALGHEVAEYLEPIVRALV